MPLSSEAVLTALTALTARVLLHPPRTCFAPHARRTLLPPPAAGGSGRVGEVGAGTAAACPERNAAAADDRRGIYGPSLATSFSPPSRIERE
jgi:hypothetical protein